MLWVEWGQGWGTRKLCSCQPVQELWKLRAPLSVIGKECGRGRRETQVSPSLARPCFLQLCSCTGFPAAWPRSLRLEGAGQTGPRSRAALGVEPVNVTKLRPGSTPSLPGAQKDDITQTEALAWMGFNSAEASTCRAQGLPGLLFGGGSLLLS